ncbi:MAG TPA: glycosyltransferase [Phycisphaerae bacterium]|nr:glycosyltransferase [Phycisphaerae bacterium]HNU47137.1 glycosyltransferase [Phycisphaerae bacterium]
MTSAFDQPTISVAVVNSADYAGGAETIARMLRDGLAGRGHRAQLFVGRRRGPDGDPGIEEIAATAAERGVAQRFARKGFFSLGVPASRRFCSAGRLDEFDLIHLHNVHGHYLCLSAVPRLAGLRPLVWTFHDYFPITGGCAFPFECEGWRSRCGSCPQLGRYPLVTPFDRTRRLQAIKRKLFAALPVTIIAPSAHLARAIESSGVFPQADVRVIPYGVDTEVFHPQRDGARQALGIAGDVPVVLVAAQGLDDPRKGVAHAVEALQRAAAPGTLVLLAGSGDQRTVADAVAPLRVRSLGYVADRAELARCYAAADLMVFTSLAENLPCVVLEAMASGTAVAAFAIPGVDEEIAAGRTGFLVPPGDAAGLARTLREVMADRAKLSAVGVAARGHIEEHFSIDLFLDRHERLYREILARRPAACAL